MKQIEIERKFLMKSLPDLPYEVIEICQFYDSGGMRFRREVSKEKTEYVKIFKKTLGRGTNEEEIFASDANEFNRHIVNTDLIITKKRHVYKNRHKFEIDVFDGIDLIMMEVEIEDIEEEIDFPSEIQNLIIREVTGDPEYNNLQIAKRKSEKNGNKV